MCISSIRENDYLPRCIAAYAPLKSRRVAGGRITNTWNAHRRAPASPSGIRRVSTNSASLLQMLWYAELIIFA
jgi:hypothetical protein